MSIKSLAYLVVETTDKSKWLDYGTNVCGMMEATSMPNNGHAYLRMDERKFRYVIEEGEFDRLSAAGWDLGSKEDFDEVATMLAKDGVEFEEVIDQDTLASRAAAGMLRLADPSGNRLEFIWSLPELDKDKDPFVSATDVEKFITKAEDGRDMGLGHVVFHAPTDFEGVHDFYQKLGFLDSDITHLDGMGKIYFMRCNPRHHSLALWSWGGPTPETDFRPSADSKAPGCVHVMAEVGSLREVGSCLDRVNERGIMVVSSLGEHINDEMKSFYMLTPGNFALEFGYEGLQLEESTPTTHNTEASIWGHKWQG